MHSPSITPTGLPLFLAIPDVRRGIQTWAKPLSPAPAVDGDVRVRFRSDYEIEHLPNYAEILEVEQLTSAADFEDGALDEIDRALAESMSFQSMGHPIRRGIDYRLDFSTGTGIKGVDILAATFGAGSSVTFDGTGRPSAGGIVRLGRGDREVIVAVDEISGKVTVSGL